MRSTKGSQPYPHKYDEGGRKENKLKGSGKEPIETC